MIAAPMADPYLARGESPAELKERIEAGRSDSPFLVYRDGDDAQRIVVFTDAITTLTVGRDPASDVTLEWDAEASRLHALLMRHGAEWTITDDGLSRNGTFVNGQRVTARRRLRDGDVILCGTTRFAFRAPRSAALEETRRAAGAPATPSISPAQRRVLVALCRPFKDASQHAVPATNQQIADELVVGIDAVKATLRALFDKFQLADVPQNLKRARLVELAFTTGVITTRDL